MPADLNHQIAAAIKHQEATIRRLTLAIAQRDAGAERPPDRTWQEDEEDLRLAIRELTLLRGYHIHLMPE